MQQPGVFIARESGLIFVPGAVAVSRGLVDVANDLLDSLDAPRRRDEATTSDGEPGTMGT